MLVQIVGDVFEASTSECLLPELTLRFNTISKPIMLLQLAPYVFSQAFCHHLNELVLLPSDKFWASDNGFLLKGGVFLFPAGPVAFCIRERRK